MRTIWLLLYWLSLVWIPQQVASRTDSVSTLFQSNRPQKSQRFRRNLTPLNVNELYDTQKGGLICNLCLVVDEQFVSAYKLADSPQIISEMRSVIDQVSWIFRNIDWNGDGISDNIGFDIISLVKGWNPYPQEQWPQYDQPKPAMELLGLFAQQDFHTCCLGIGFINRPFEHDQVGVSFIASESLLGGICDFRNPTLPLRSSNVVLISAKGLKGTQLTTKDLSHILVHEIGHTFGVLKHDMDLNTLDTGRCSGFSEDKPLPPNYLSDNVVPPEGRFIMWGQDIQGLKNFRANNLDFSRCSKEAVTAIIYSGDNGRTHCLVKSVTTFCGNGIVEYPEECDCGNEISCQKDGCCGSRTSSAPCQLFKGIVPKKCPLLKGQQKETTPKNKKNRSGTLVLNYYAALISISILCLNNMQFKYVKLCLNEMSMSRFNKVNNG